MLCNACGLFATGRWLCAVRCRALFVVGCVLFDVSWPLFCLLCVVCCALFVFGWLMCVACGLV